MAREGSMRALLPITRQGPCPRAMTRGSVAWATLEPRVLRVAMMTLRAGWGSTAT